MDMKQAMIDNPILAIMRNIPTEKVLNYVSAAMDGGVRLFEVALNSKDAYEQIRLLKKNFKNIPIGAGTAISVERVKAAMEAGADFLLSPSTDEDVLAYCKKNEIAIMPGALTPSDVSKCVRYGFTVIKLFPAGDMPMGYIKSLKGPFDETEYVAIGGVNKENMAEFFKQGYLGVGIGSNIIPNDMIQRNAWEEASAYVAELVAIAKKFR